MTCRDCISFAECLEYESTPYYGLDAACNNVEELCENFKNKADFVEVVRCKDCNKTIGRSITGDRLCVVHEISVPDDYYCASGERRDT